MRLKSVFFFILLFSGQLAFSQDPADFLPLLSQGKIPEEFKKESSEKFEEDASEISKDKKRKERKMEENFLLQSTFIIDNMLLSGKVIFNDPVGDYVNRVADKVLEEQPGLREQLHFYIVKSPYVNAFATDRGIIFVTTGLISQLENEAQLAFILAHEIIHFKEKHALNNYIETQLIRNERSNYKRTNIEEKLLAKSAYSKELEMEADKKGFGLFSKTAYAGEEIHGAFDVLQYSYLPFDDIVFQRSFFQDEHYVFPDKYFLEETASIAADDDYDDSYSSHPNIRKRRNIIHNLLNDDNAKGEKFLVSKEEFMLNRDICRFAHSRLYINKRQYGRALYNTYMLLEKYPENKYLKKCMGYTLYALAAYASEERRSYEDPEIEEVLKDFEEVEGESQQVYHFLSKLDKKELNTLALRYLWDVKKSFPDDAFINEITKECFELLVLHNELRQYDYQSQYPKEEDTVIIDSSKLSKYDKIKLKKQQEEKLNYYAFAFVENFSDKKFLNAFNDLEEAAAEGKDKEETNYYSREDKEKFISRGMALGIDKVVFFDPTYIKVDKRKDIAIKYLDAEERQKKFTETIRKSAEIAGLEVNLINNKSLDNTEEFNDLSLLTHWADERFSHENVNVTCFEKNFTSHLPEKYNTNYFGMTGMIGYRAKKDRVAATLILTALTVYFLPYGLYYALTPEHFTYYYTYLFNLKTGTLPMVKSNMLELKATKDLMNTYIYDTMHQISNSK